LTREEHATFCTITSLDWKADAWGRMAKSLRWTNWALPPLMPHRSTRWFVISKFTIALIL
jgi:hypothetical protein